MSILKITMKYLLHYKEIPCRRPVSRGSAAEQRPQSRKWSLTQAHSADWKEIPNTLKWLSSLSGSCRSSFLRTTSTIALPWRAAPFVWCRPARRASSSTGSVIGCMKVRLTNDTDFDWLSRVMLIFVLRWGRWEDWYLFLYLSVAYECQHFQHCLNLDFVGTLRPDVCFQTGKTQTGSNRSYENPPNCSSKAPKISPLGNRCLGKK